MCEFQNIKVFIYRVQTLQQGFVIVEICLTEISHEHKVLWHFTPMMQMWQGSIFKFKLGYYIDK